MEEISASDIKKRPNLKELYLEASGKEVKLDYFLFTCHEEETTYRALPELHRKQFDAKRWPYLVPQVVGLSELEAQQKLADKDLASLMAELFAWYLHQYPIFEKSQTLDYMVQSEILGPFIRMVIDAKALIQQKTGEPLPLIDPEGGVEPDQSEVWRLLAAKVQESFPAYSERMLTYLKWSLRKGKPKTYDLASLPPVGRFAAILQSFKRRTSRGGSSSFSERGDRARRGGPGGERSGRPDRDRDNRDNRDNRDKGRDRDRDNRGRDWERDHDRPRGVRDRGHSSLQVTAPKGGSFGGRSGFESPGRAAGSRPPRGPRADKQDRPHEGQQKLSPQEKEALQEVDSALKKMQKARQIKDFLLKPQNSFIRRQQHKKIVESGFESESVGDGPTRAVKITRK